MNNATYEKRTSIFMDLIWFSEYYDLFPLTFFFFSTFVLFVVIL